MVTTIWVAVAFVLGAYNAAAFTDKAECLAAVARVQAAMVEDGVGDGDALSRCVEVEVKLAEPK
jgi:hypothetical protein